tara:strand:- start:9004 stop:9324 length:321 start_codon:yes stop_codon:yes gene_type:complete
LWAGKRGVINKLGVSVNDPDTALDVNGAITIREMADPGNPDSGAAVIWMDKDSDRGDLYIRVNVGGTIKTFELTDFVGSYVLIAGMHEGVEYDIVSEDGFTLSAEV